MSHEENGCTGSWEQYGTSRKCADCGEYLSPLSSLKRADDFLTGAEFAVISLIVGPYDVSEERAAHAVHVLKNAVLKAAAEKIRAMDQDFYYDESADGIWNLAADLIDPEVDR